MRHTRSTVILDQRDTSQKAEEIYFQRLREMTPSERLAAGITLMAAGDALQWAALRHQDPAATEDEIAFRIAVSRWGPDLAEKVYRKRKRRECVPPSND